MADGRIPTDWQDEPRRIRLTLCIGKTVNEWLKTNAKLQRRRNVGEQARVELEDLFEDSLAEAIEQGAVVLETETEPQGKRPKRA